MKRGPHKRDVERPAKREPGKIAVETKPSWTVERVAALHRMWAEGFSAAEVAAALGGVSRNAVLGKVHRAGLATRPAKPVKMKAAANRAVKVRPLRVPHARRSQSVCREIKAMIDPPPADRKALVDLERHHCRWPIGDPGHPDFGFCGADKFAGLPYCEGHARVACQPIEKKTPRPVATVEAPTPMVTAADREAA